ncbi:sodium-dependent transporter [Sphingomonas alpina]|nr:sodium-dependent transporter [Sphingomonas alpina]
MQQGEVQGEQWSSRLAFLYSIGAAAIGLGTLWRFPYVAGANGGGAFVILYILFVMAICVPLMIAEMAIGKRGHGSAMTSVDSAIIAAGAWRGWRTIGTLSLLIPFFGLSYYSIVAGWAIDYSIASIARGFAGFDAEQSRAMFGALAASPVRGGLLQLTFIMATAIVVGLGVRRGIETVSRIKMIALFVILIGLVIYNALTVGLGPSTQFLLQPDFAALGAEGVLTALGQALFSTAVGVGVLITYSAYLPAESSLPRSSMALAGGVIIVALLTGFAIFPAVLAYGLKPAEGPNLIFVTLPIVFGKMAGGRIIAILFFGLIALGAFTTAVGMLEPVVAWLREKTGMGRAPLAAMAGFAIWLVGLPSLLSFSTLSDFHPLAFAGMTGKTAFDLLDFTIANLLLPANALLLAVFVGWSCRGLIGARETGLAPRMLGAWRFVIRFVAPIAILGLGVHLLL